MTERHFWVDPYCCALQSQVAEVQGARVRLNKTIFFAECGGQESDHGTIGAYPVQAAHIEQDDLWHTLPTDHALVAGMEVQTTIDWPRRYALMRLHFAAEIVLELAMSDFDLVEKIGAHISVDKARIDFATTTPISAILPELASLAQGWIDADRAIDTGFASDGRRYWRVGGLAQVPCAGTHLRRTGEVGRLSLKRKNVGSGKERIEIRVQPLA